ncbi:MAG: nucleotidyltransferase family protein [Deltaproteobacteria bacterium]|nr:nucleotidyltransferase family protein [Deltaproteobacteria bacterium]
MKAHHTESKIAAADLLDNIRGLHPNLQFCGEPRNAILRISDDLLRYVLSLLNDNNPIHVPRATIEEWFELLRILESHWITPLLYRQLGGLSDEFRPPKPVVDRMRTIFQWSRTRCFHMERQLREIVAAFNEAEVEVLTLKGPALGRTVYPDPALRPSSDLDLLVRPDQMVSSREILENLGYKCEARLFDAEEILYKDEKFVHLNNPRVYRAIELHWRLHHWLGIQQDTRTEELFDRAINVESPSLNFKALGPVDAVIHTAINNAFGHDDAIRLIWIYDIKMLALKLAVPNDWKLLQKRCVEWRARRAVELSLEMARAWMGLRLPQNFADYSTWPQPADIEINTWQKVVHRQHRFLSIIRLRMPPCSGNLERLRLFARLVFPLRDKVCRDFPPPHALLFPLSYVRRWWHWLKTA